MFVNSLFFALLICTVATSWAKLELSNIPPNRIAIIQFDSRPLKNYWETAARWNANYCQLHSHQYIYYSTKDKCHHGHEPLADAWCKVQAMLNANDDFPEIEIFFYLDSDAVIDKAFAQMSLNEMIGIMQARLDWNPVQKPIVFNQDGPCWWCTFIIKIGYNMCLNAGTVVWYRHPISREVLQDWWDASMDSYETNPIKRKFRIKWPWEQDRQMALFNRSSHLIQIASQPERIYMQLRAGVTNGWCLSHLPEAQCFISHYCANGKSKQKMKQLYSEFGSSSSVRSYTSIELRSTSVYTIASKLEFEYFVEYLDKATWRTSGKRTN